jgi:hypothetical protein
MNAEETLNAINMEYIEYVASQDSEPDTRTICIGLIQQAINSATADLRAENERLKEVVEKLPKTADGVPVVPGMTIYDLRPSGCTPFFVSAVFEKASKHNMYADCYSTREAAEAAQKGGK